MVKIIIKLFNTMSDISDDEKNRSLDKDIYDYEAKETYYKNKFDNYVDKHNKKKRIFLKKGEGKLASNYHGMTEYAYKRKKKVYEFQEKLEQDPNYIDNPIDYKYRK